MAAIINRTYPYYTRKAPPVAGIPRATKITGCMRCTARLDSSLNSPAAEAWRAPLSPARQVLSCAPDGRAALLTPEGEITRAFPTPIAALAWLDEARRQMAPRERWVGYLSYDLGRWFEALPVTAADDLALPLFVFARHEITETPSPLTPAKAPPPGELAGSSLSQPQYLATIARAIDYIGAGDIFQVNLAQRLTVKTPIAPQDLYARIQHLHPAHYAALLDHGDFALVCNSPELFLAVHHEPSSDGNPCIRVITRPIKGTRPRLPGMEEELRLSAKDAAELNMIIDLERNDLGRVCRTGSVRVTQPRVIETHPTVYHGAATVEGLLRPEVGLVELLRATFPGGSITGAPKIRAMQIIDELEPVQRGPYCGAIGYLDADGSMQFNIAIRTLICMPGVVYIPVGGGIVADSTPQSEYDETLTKAHAALSALGLR
jgi:para-aminobenzoate synthetase component I